MSNNRLEDLSNELRLIQQEHDEQAARYYPSLDPKRKRPVAAPAEEEPEPEEKRAREAATDKHIRFDYALELKCPICCDLLQQPVMQCPKQHLFCGACVDRLLSNPTLERRCPTCREALPRKLQAAPRLVDSLLERVPHACIYRGCPETSIPKLEFEAHKSACPHAPASCSNAAYGCDWDGKRSGLEAHLSAECKYVTVRLTAERVRSQLDERGRQLASMQLELDRLAAFVRSGAENDTIDAMSNVAAVTNFSIRLRFDHLNDEREADWYNCRFAVGLYARQLDGRARLYIYLRMRSSECHSQDRPLVVCARAASRGELDERYTPFAVTSGALAPPLPLRPLVCRHGVLRETEAEAARGVVPIRCDCGRAPSVPSELALLVPEHDPSGNLAALVSRLPKMSLLFKISTFIEPKK